MATERGSPWETEGPEPGQALKLSPRQRSTLPPPQAMISYSSELGPVVLDVTVPGDRHPPGVNGH
jgi:hypothetical protein